MVFRWSGWHHLGFGQHGSGHLLQALYYFVSTECRRLAVDDECHRLSTKHNVAVHLAHAGNAGQRVVGIVGWIQLQEHRHVIDEMTVFRTRHNALAFHLYSVERINLRL